MVYYVIWDYGFGGQEVSRCETPDDVRQEVSRNDGAAIRGKLEMIIVGQELDRLEMRSMLDPAAHTMPAGSPTCSGS